MSEELWTAIDKRLTELVQLPVGWDGHGGKPTRPGYAEDMKEMLRLLVDPTDVYDLRIDPESDGTVRATWSESGGDLCGVDVGPGGQEFWRKIP